MVGGAGAVGVCPAVAPRAAGGRTVVGGGRDVWAQGSSGHSRRHRHSRGGQAGGGGGARPRDPATAAVLQLCLARLAPWHCCKRCAGAVCACCGAHTGFRRGQAAAVLEHDVIVS